METTIWLLNKHYYGSILLLVLAFLAVLLLAFPPIAMEQAVGIIIERYAIMITIIAIPFSLKFFAHRLKKLERPLETEIAIIKYKRASYLRLYTLSAVSLMLILLFAISRNMNYFWFTVVLFIVFLFCKPSFAELENLTIAPEKQSAPEEEHEQPEGISCLHTQIEGDAPLGEGENTQPQEVDQVEPEEENK